MNRQPAPSAAIPLPRVGIGVDVHAFAPGRLLWLGGLLWPDETGLAGHSDADVACHAACNALLSAAGLGDLGAHFGTDRPEWADAGGTTLLGETARLLTSAGWVIGNVAVQVVGPRPRLAPRRVEAERVMTDACGAPVALSAATTDGLGFVGRAEGLVGMATAIVWQTPVDRTTDMDGRLPR